MLKYDELVELYRELRAEQVLSVFIDGRTSDFSEHNLWRKRLDHEVSELRERLRADEPGDTRTFDSALAKIEEALEEYDRFLPDRGWVGFATAERLVYADTVSVPMPDLVRWESGIRVAPYVRALKQDRVVVGVLVDSRRARVFEYKDGTLRESKDLLAETFLGDLTDATVSKRASSNSGVRGRTGTDAAHRFLEVGAERMLKRLAEVVGEIAGPDGLVVIGGVAEQAANAIQHLPAGLAGRTTQRSSMSVEMADADVQDALESAASDLNRSIQGELLQEVIDQARSGGRGALGPESVEQAVREGRVDTLLLSRDFIGGNPDYADHLVGAAFEHGGEVEELSSEGADRLDVEGRGVAARLRYQIQR